MSCYLKLFLYRSFEDETNKKHVYLIDFFDSLETVMPKVSQIIICYVRSTNDLLTFIAVFRDDF